MNIKFEQDPRWVEPEVIIRSNDPKLAAKLKAQLDATEATLAVYQGAKESYLPLAAIIFIQTEGGQLQVHTKDDLYLSKERLYTLAARLPGIFLQVSKSTIINLLAVSALNRSLSNCLVSFGGTHKQIYASRRYYKQLTERLDEMRGL
ncbi:MAG: LytTR family transcriptional regulator [Lactobacillus sp.]|jgi:DNA-binding LytR/AlgR family response regulator|uniref:LytTR family DNA-binding domain-containing protein n=1 Tax=Lacticaseibacillus suilingensis TaxID=2799577 RepID=A0ABW4BD45_9LACO|nr:LytTR family DNA-binding domain-containing protein [Lacticaseibacillus suilingensis]MCI1893850.1 LytTR family transcriptional regulator [Lactobacillus sp.]MCI1917645.1 LytTR family transcriptional regulator [Lactobacillus sp.]MCI1941643.1 LytTR family transcriptional regulator [Lactobacillus sp.]MCI1972189.1 LytTR family transcriptional regulator [Lactobacillus sp.]MCI2017128.1 LytTR family transcriptional regulator [Lactobacillus sp.]